MTDRIRQLAAQMKSSPDDFADIGPVSWTIGDADPAFLELGDPLPVDFGKETEKRAPAIAFSGSIAIHALLLLLLLSHWEQAPLSQQKPMVVEISLQDLPLDDVPPVKVPPPRRQMVSPSTAESRKPPPETTQLSDRDQATPVETIKRGDGGGSQTPPTPTTKAPPPQEKPAPERQTEAKSESKSESKTAPKAAKQIASQKQPPSESKSSADHTDSPALSERPARGPRRSGPLLKLDDQTMAARFGEATPQQPESASEKSSANAAPTERERVQKFHHREPFSRGEPFSMFSGRGGSADYLPQVQDGDITLLNAKADRYAVFVRRVALQVFGSLRRQSWQELPMAEVRRIREFTKVKARMSTAGKLVDVELLESSGSAYFDRLVMNAARESCWDQNPPKEAVAEDGTISFIFDSRTWARGADGNAREQRWLLLGTGLL